jgi:hypothetical protein
MGLVDVSHQFKQHCRARAWGRWTWRMRRGGRRVSSQCDYFLGREIDRGKFHNISLRMPSCHDLDHHIIVAKIYPGAEKKLKAYQLWRHCFPIKLPHGPQEELETLFEDLPVDVAPSPEKERPKK